jgi:hypothetical protein
LGKKNIQVLIHVISCFAFLTLPLVFVPGYRSTPLEVLQNPFTQKDILINFLMILFFYLNFYLLIPKLYFNKKYIYYGLSVLASFVVIIVVSHYFFPEPPRPAPPPGFPDRPFGPRPGPRSWFLFEAGHSLLKLAVLFFLSLLLRITSQWKQAEKEKTDTELSYLKAQINPHFLFNTLNSLYSLALEKSDKTPAAIVKLSSMMRYVITDAHADYVPLSQELEYVRSYIDLQKLRFDTTIMVDYEEQGDTNGKHIAPLILIPFIENAFKYGVNAEEKSLIRINVLVSIQSMKLEIYNRKTSRPMLDEPQNGLGIETTRNRLNLLYPGKHELTIVDGQEDFLVTLLLNLK